MALFETFFAQWTPVVFSRELGRKPVGITVAGTPVALFRDEGGQARALLDGCPHRGARLSLGRVEQGALECPFHGWRFGGDGACRFVPLSGLSDEERGRVHALPLATHEAAGLVFIFTSPGAQPAEVPHVAEELTREGVHVARHAEIWNTHWSRAMENMLDAPHVPFIHGATIGRALRRRMTPRSAMTITVNPTDYGFRTASALRHDSRPDAANESSGAWLDWVRPNGMVLDIPIPGKRFRQHVYCIPVDADHTRMMLMTTRDFAVHNPLASLGDLFSIRVMSEDRRVIESVRPREVPPPEKEHSASTDRATLAFRRWYFEALKGDRQVPGVEA